MLFKYKLIYMKKLTLEKLFLACRPRQWIKNILVFSAPLFNFQLETSIWLSGLGVFISFCLVSSAIYLFNDCLDIESDKKHPVKKLRPIASGHISVTKALCLSVFLFLASLCIAWKIANIVILILCLYAFIQILYCIGLKKEPILDIFCISSGFLLRAIAGLAACGLPSSPWFLLTIGLSALFLAIEKRKAELRLSYETGFITRQVLKRYSLPLLLRFEILVSTSSFVTYSLWASGPALKGASSSLMMLTVPFVLLGVFRYQLLSDPEEAKRRREKYSEYCSERPEEILLRDRGIQLILLCWLLTTAIIGFLI